MPQYVHLVVLQNPDVRGEDVAIQIKVSKPIRSAVEVLRKSSSWSKHRDWNLVGFMVGEDQGEGRPPKVIYGEVPKIAARTINLSV